MNDRRADHLRVAAPSLTAAVRRARVEEAERSDVIDDLRGAELARLEALHEAIQPVLAQVPEGVDIFDAGVVPGDRPRLFIDMIAFVDMARDRRGYRFVQDARHGRVTIAESERIDTMVDAITAYIARRLVERDKAQASAQITMLAPGVVSGAAFLEAHAPVAAPLAAASPAQRPHPRAARRGRWRWRHWFASSFRFVLEFLGSVTLVALVWAGAYLVWVNYLRALWAAYLGAAPL